MNTRPLGRTGVRVSPLCLGTMMFGAWGNADHDDSVRIIHRALDAGINFVDTADVYAAGESEEIVGKALAGGRRDDVVLATKVHGAMGDDPNRRGNSRRWITRAVDDSLRRLSTDWIDLYQLHNPDPNTPIEETLAALNDLVAEGKVRYLGSSNLSGWQVVDADWVARTSGYEGFVSAHNEYSWLNRSAEAELIPALEHTGQSLLPYFPLASGLLTGKYRRGEPAPEGSRLAKQTDPLQQADFDTIEAIERFARDRDVSMLQVAIGGLAAMPTVASVIAGATSVEQVQQNVEAGLWAPSGEDLEELLKITSA